jgi:hypothetical protein
MRSSNTYLSAQVGDGLLLSKWLNVAVEGTTVIASRSSTA